MQKIFITQVNQINMGLPMLNPVGVCAGLVYTLELFTTLGNTDKFYELYKYILYTPPTALAQLIKNEESLIQKNAQSFDYNVDIPQIAELIIEGKYTNI